MDSPRGPAGGGASQHHQTPRLRLPSRFPLPSPPPLLTSCHVLVLYNPRRGARAIPSGLGPEVDGPRLVGRPALPFLTAPASFSSRSPQPWVPVRGIPPSLDSRAQEPTHSPSKTLLTLPCSGRLPRWKEMCPLCASDRCFALAKIPQGDTAIPT